MGRPSAAAQDTRLPPRASAPAPFRPRRAAPCPAQRSWPHLPAKQQLNRLFWQKHALTVTQLSRKKHFPFFSWRGSRQFPERSSDHSQRQRARSGSDGGTPFASALWAPGGTSFTFPTAEWQQLILGTLQDQPHGATRQPKGVPCCPDGPSS